MAPLQFWIRGDLRVEQRERLEAIGATATPMMASRRNTEDARPVTAWTRIDTQPGEVEAERARIATAIGVEAEKITGPYALH